MDYSFSRINQEAAWGAPSEAMQFGKALNRILQLILAANWHGPTYMLKLDLSDGFYRVRLRVEDIPTLDVAFPVGPGEDPLVVLPLTLPMGWMESPPYFSSATETAVDLINLHASPSWDPPRHPLELAAGTQPPQDGRHCITVPTPTFSPPPRLPVPPQLPPAQRHHHCRPLAYGTSSSMTKSYWRRAPLPSYTISNAKHSTSMTGSSVGTTFTTIQQATRRPSPKASCSRGSSAGPPPR